MWYDALTIFCGMLFSYGQATNASIKGTVKDLNVELLWAQPSLLRIMLPDLLQDLLVMKKEVTKYSNFPLVDLTVIAQYLVYQEVFRRFYLKFK
jgi:hypothetical protein